jgi:hypothetical protein
MQTVTHEFDYKSLYHLVVRQTEDGYSIRVTRLDQPFIRAGLGFANSVEDSCYKTAEDAIAAAKLKIDVGEWK